MRPLVVACALTCALAAPAGAAGVGDGSLDEPPTGPRVTVGLEVIAPGDDGGPSYGPGDTDAPRPVRYEAIPAQSPPPGLENLCNAARGPVTAGAVPWGWWYTIVAIDNATGNVISREQMCVPLPVPGAIEPPGPPALPTPPTIAEIWDAVGIPAPALGVSPTDEGVVGLGTWLWSGGPSNRQVAVSLDGYTVTGDARLGEYRFDAGDGAPTTATTAGSRADPAATHVYDVKGEYALRVGAVWDATVTMTGPGLVAPLPIAIGRAVVTSARAYGVVEVRSVLVP